MAWDKVMEFIKLLHSKPPEFAPDYIQALNGNESSTVKQYHILMFIVKVVDRLARVATTWMILSFIRDMPSVLSLLG